MRLDRGAICQETYIYVTCKNEKDWRTLDRLQETFPGRHGDCYGIRPDEEPRFEYYDTVWLSLEGVKALYRECRQPLPSNGA